MRRRQALAQQLGLKTTQPRTISLSEIAPGKKAEGAEPSPGGSPTAALAGAAQKAKAETAGPETIVQETVTVEETGAQTVKAAQSKGKNRQAENGWIKLWRKIQDNPFWTSEKFSRGQAWVDLLILANHKPQIIRIRGIDIKLKRGQLAWSMLNLSKRWKWSEKKVRHFLSDLEKEGMATNRKSELTTVITIKNYSQYQENVRTEDEQKSEQNLGQTSEQKDEQKFNKTSEQNQSINTGLPSTFQGQEDEQNLDRKDEQKDEQNLEAKIEKRTTDKKYKEEILCVSPKGGEPLTREPQKPEAPTEGKPLTLGGQDPVGTPPPRSEGTGKGPGGNGAGPRKPKKQTDPRVKQVMDYFHATFLKLKGVKPKIDGKDAKRVEEALITMELDEIKDCIVCFLKSPKSKELSPTLSVALCSSIVNQYRTEKVEWDA